MKPVNQFTKVYTEDVKRFNDPYIAIILGKIRGWCEYNKKKGIKQSDGYYWSGHLSLTELSEQTGLELRTVKRKMKFLVKNGIIQRGNFNKKSYDATGWYRVLEVVSESHQGSDTESPGVVSESHQPSDREVPTIPNNPLESFKEFKESFHNAHITGALEQHKEFVESIKKEIEIYGNGAVNHYLNKLKKNIASTKQDRNELMVIKLLKDSEPDLFNLK
jgi:DNA-binding Lrp family transcriptional regulator